MRFGLSLTAAFMVAALSPAFAQTPPNLPIPTGELPPPIVKEGKAQKISPHVWVIPDDYIPMVPNVGYVIGEKGVLVIDPGMGQRNGEIVLKEMRKLTNLTDVTIVNTHFHPEHTTGDLAFPQDVKLIRAVAQQQDVDELGVQFLGIFSRMRPILNELLQGASYRKPTATFEKETVIDLGGVKVRAVRLGPGHTRGDTVFYVEGDEVLFSGDLAMRNLFPSFIAPQSSAKTWLTSLDAIDQFKAKQLVPAHGAITDGSVVGAYRDYMKALQERVATLKREGKPLPDVIAAMRTEFAGKQPQWQQAMRIEGAVTTIYNEAP